MTDLTAADTTPRNDRDKTGWISISRRITATPTTDGSIVVYSSTE